MTGREKKQKKKNKDDRIVISRIHHVNFGANCFIKFHLWVQQIVALYEQIYHVLYLYLNNFIPSLFLFFFVFLLRS